MVLVHGACHGAWCWDGVTPHLMQRGHAVVAPDLPIDDPRKGLDDYATAVASTMPEDSRDVVLVGHSLGALAVPMVAARRDVAAIVFLAGIIGMPGKSLADLAELDAERDGPLGDEDYVSFDNGTFVFTEAGARRTLYHDCDETATRNALARLRPQRSMWTQVMAVDSWPSTRFASVVCTNDRIVNPEWSRRIARERLGVEAVLFESGHTPMLARPADLAAVLNRLSTPEPGLDSKGTG